MGGDQITRISWCAHDTMTDDPDGEVPPPRQPGVNGLAHSPRTGFLRYTSTAQLLAPGVRN